MTDIDVAERIGRRRARAFPLLALVFLSQQFAYFSAGDGDRLVDQVKISAWALLSIILVAALATGGGWLRSRQVRALLNDETTREHRRKAVATGFWMAMGAGIGTYVVAMYEAVSGREAVHIIVTVGIATALLHFGLLERRALGDG